MSNNCYITKRREVSLIQICESVQYISYMEGKESTTTTSPIGKYGGDHGFGRTEAANEAAPLPATRRDGLIGLLDIAINSQLIKI